jgi:hypothetical protein
MLMAIPEWYLVIVGLAGLVLLGLAWEPLLWAGPLLVGASVALVAQAARGAAQATFSTRPRTRLEGFGRFALTTLLFLLQPLARLYGRLSSGLTPWRPLAAKGLASPPRPLTAGRPESARDRSWGSPQPQVYSCWSETWHASEERLRALEAKLQNRGAIVQRGGDFDPWDLEIGAEPLFVMRLHMAVEEHGGGKQMVRFRVMPRVTRLGVVLLVLLGALALWAGRAGSPLDDGDPAGASFVSGVFTILVLLISLRGLLGLASISAALAHAIPESQAGLPPGEEA